MRLNIIIKDKSILSVFSERVNFMFKKLFEVWKKSKNERLLNLIYFFFILVLVVFLVSFRIL